MRNSRPLHEGYFDLLGRTPESERPLASFSTRGSPAHERIATLTEPGPCYGVASRAILQDAIACAESGYVSSNRGAANG